MQAIVASSFIPVYAGFKDLPKIRGRVSRSNTPKFIVPHPHLAVDIHGHVCIWPGAMASWLHCTTERVWTLQPWMASQIQQGRAHDQGSRWNNYIHFLLTTKNIAQSHTILHNNTSLVVRDCVMLSLGGCRVMWSMSIRLHMEIMDGVLIYECC